MRDSGGLRLRRIRKARSSMACRVRPFALVRQPMCWGRMPSPLPSAKLANPKPAAAASGEYLTGKGF